MADTFSWQESVPDTFSLTPLAGAIGLSGWSLWSRCFTRARPGGMLEWPGKSTLEPTRRFRMSRPRRSVAALALAILGGWGSIALACTSIVVSRGASKDGSIMVTYSADAPFMPKLLYVPGGKHQAGELIQIRGWEDDRLCGPIKQVASTYSVVGLMNEHQLSLGETTTGGRRELRDPRGMLDYDALMLLTLQRARTAREAIKTIDELAREYGYQSSGETFSIADSKEAWIMELIGKGTDQKWIVWVAARVPDGMLTAHA